MMGWCAAGVDIGLPKMVAPYPTFTQVRGRLDILTYGQNTTPGSPHQVDQLKLFSRKDWPTLPFRSADVARQQVGETLVLIRP